MSFHAKRIEKDKRNSIIKIVIDIMKRNKKKGRWEKTMVKGLKKKFVSFFMLTMATLMLLTPITSHADFWQESKVVGNGVRLRRSPVNGTILELMYYGEAILIDPDVYDPDYSAWLYVKRVKTGTVGWMEWSYFEHH